ncbi:MAG: crossover junction endodeoxyribonuclease RuvC [Sphingobacteriia bacterium]|nr:crossover junction endodeoxyribonuclease RuvC [Sphingobacteriia bacterium]
MRILGIDPGLNNVGWGIIDKNGSKIVFVASGAIKTSSKESLDKRLLHISENIKQVIEAYTPQTVAIEETYVNVNPKSSLVLGIARGAIILTVASLNVPCSYYEPMLIKKTITGSGKADKEQIQKMVRLLLPTADFATHDAADALAIAFCHSSFCR